MQKIEGAGRNASSAAELWHPGKESHFQERKALLQKKKMIRR